MKDKNYNGAKCLISCIIVALVIIWGFSFDSYAKDESEPVFVDCSQYILQDGGLLKEQTKAVKGSLRSTRSGADDQSELRERIVDAIANFKGEIDLSDLTVTYDEFINEFTDVINAYPMFFYTNSYSYSTYTNGNMAYVWPVYKYGQDEAMIKKQKIEEQISVFLNGVDASWSDMEKVLYLNDYLAETCEYDKNYNDTSLANPNRFDIYGVLVDHVAVCQGYAITIKQLCTEMGIDTYLVSSDELGHAWNMIKINDKYYMLDTTWNDPMPDKIGKAYHKNFMKSYTFFNSPGSTPEEKTHYATDYVVQSGLDPTLCSDTSYDSYFWDDIYNPFKYVNEKWYNSDSFSSGQNHIFIYSCDGVDFVKDSAAISLESIPWPVDTSGFNYYPAYACVSLTSFDGKLLYSNPTRIVEYDFKTGNSKTLYELSDGEAAHGYIYGIAVTPDYKLKYQVSTSPNLINGSYGTIYEKSLSEFYTISTPTPRPTPTPTPTPTATPTATVTPTTDPRIDPTPTDKPATPDITPTEEPTSAATPTKEPSATTDPISLPTADPTNAPTSKPTNVPTSKPTETPSSRAAIGTKWVTSVGMYEVTGSTSVKYTAPIDKKADTVNIPATVVINGELYLVTEIKSGCFKGFKNLKSVIIGPNVKKIGSKAFYGCKKLKTVTIRSAKLSKIGSKAFKGIHKNAKFYLPKKKYSKYKKMLKKAGAPKKAKYKKNK